MLERLLADKENPKRLRPEVEEAVRGLTPHDKSERGVSPSRIK